MSDSFTKVTSQSYFSRIGGAFKGIIAGIILIVIGFGLLFWNEGRAVKRYKTLKEGSGAVISVSSDTLDESNSGQLVHMTGNASTGETLSDPIFNISDTALRLRRKVEMWQWKENSKSTTEKKLGGGTDTIVKYTYTKGWSESLINSSRFEKPEGHRNPDSMPWKSDSFNAKNVTIGAYKLSSGLVSEIDNWQSLRIKNSTKLPSEIKSRSTVTDGGLFIGRNSSNPEIGDMRVKFEIVEPQDISIVARQVSNSFEPYRTSTGGTIQLLETGIHSADAMFTTAQENNATLTWILRLVGLILMIVGFDLIFRPLSVLADVIPLLGNIVGIGTGIISFLLGLSLWMITVAIAWIVYRPLIGVTLLIFATGIMILVGTKLKKA